MLDPRTAHDIVFQVLAARSLASDRGHRLLARRSGRPAPRDPQRDNARR
jgi:hypothetical protein